MAGEIQLNSTTLATESSGSITAQLDTIRPNTTNGSLVLQGDSSDAGVTGLTIDSSGNATFAQTISGGTLGSSVVFPAGHVIQTVSDQYVTTSAITVSTTSDDYLGSNLQCTITPKANGNKLFIQAFIQGIFNNSVDGRSLHSGFAYDASFSSGNGTTIGPRAVIADYAVYIGSNLGLLGNLQYSIIVTVGTEAPSSGSASIIRPILQSTLGDIQIATNSSSGLGVFSMMVMEIQA